MKVLSAVDNALGKIIGFIVGLLMMSLTAFVVVQVLARYVFHFSLGGAEELPIYMLICVVWSGAVCNARSDSHIKVDLFSLIVKNAKVNLIVKVITDAITVAFLAIFSSCGFSYLQKSMVNNDVTSGLRIPLWVFHFIIVICLCLMTIYYLVHLIAKAKEVAEWKS